MQTLVFENKTYNIDEDDFLMDSEQWDRGFAEAMAPRAGISEGLNSSHWDVLDFIRQIYVETGLTPLVHKTCKALDLRLSDLERLFPEGYQRGACKLAGLSYMTLNAPLSCLSKAAMPPEAVPVEKRIYRVNIDGFLVDPNEWDLDFAAHKAHELKMTLPLSGKQCQTIDYLRSEFSKTGKIPTVYQTCAAIGMDIDEFGELFPDGYHRGAVKLAGLCLSFQAAINETASAASKR